MIKSRFFPVIQTRKGLSIRVVLKKKISFEKNFFFEKMVEFFSNLLFFHLTSISEPVQTTKCPNLMLLWPNMYAPVSVRLLWGVPAKSRNLHNSAYTSRTANLALCAIGAEKYVYLFYICFFFVRKETCPGEKLVPLFF